MNRPVGVSNGGRSIRVVASRYQGHESGYEREHYDHRSRNQQGWLRVPPPMINVFGRWRVEGRRDGLLVLSELV